MKQLLWDHAGSCARDGRVIATRVTQASHDGRTNVKAARAGGRGERRNVPCRRARRRLGTPSQQRLPDLLAAGEQDVKEKSTSRAEQPRGFRLFAPRLHTTDGEDTSAPNHSATSFRSRSAPCIELVSSRRRPPSRMARPMSVVGSTPLAFPSLTRETETTPSSSPSSRCASGRGRSAATTSSASRDVQSVDREDEVPPDPGAQGSRGAPWRGTGASARPAPPEVIEVVKRPSATGAGSTRRYRRSGG